MPLGKAAFPSGPQFPKSEPKELEKVVSWEGAALPRFLAGVHVPWWGEMWGEGPAVVLSRGPWYKANVLAINIELTDAKPHPQPLNK